MILGPFLIKSNLDGATKNRLKSSNKNQVTQMVSSTKNIQENRVSLFTDKELYRSVPFTFDSNDNGGSLRMDGRVSIMNDAIDIIIIMIEIIATTRAMFDDSGHSKISQILRWSSLTGR